MDKRSATRLMNKAVRAFNTGSPDFQGIMDDASVYLSDEQWDELERLIEEASKTPALPETPQQEQVRLEAAVTRLRGELQDAEARLYAFYCRKGRKQSLTK